MKKRWSNKTWDRVEKLDAGDLIKLANKMQNLVFHIQRLAEKKLGKGGKAQ